MTKIVWEQPSGTPIRIPESAKATLSYMRKQTTELRITVEPVYKQRTEDQNAIFHAKVNEIAKECGANREWIKDQIKELAVSHGYPADVKDGKLIPKSSKDVTIEQMEILIESVFEYAFENGINIRS